MSQFHLSKKSKRRLQEVHPLLVQFVKDAILKSPIDFLVFEGLRSLERQREYVARGVSKKMESKHLEQEDGYSHAVDLVPIVHGQARWEIDPCIQIAAAMADVASAAAAWSEPDWRLVWGGGWSAVATSAGMRYDPEREMLKYIDRCRKENRKPFVDGPHFEIRFR